MRSSKRAASGVPMMSDEELNGGGVGVGVEAGPPRIVSAAERSCAVDGDADGRELPQSSSTLADDG